MSRGRPRELHRHQKRSVWAPASPLLLYGSQQPLRLPHRARGSAYKTIAAEFRGAAAHQDSAAREAFHQARAAATEVGEYEIGSAGEDARSQLRESARELRT